MECTEGLNSCPAFQPCTALQPGRGAHEAGPSASEAEQEDPVLHPEGDCPGGIRLEPHPGQEPGNARGIQVQALSFVWKNSKVGTDF